MCQLKQPLKDVNLIVRLADKENRVVREGKLEKGEIKFSVAQLPSGTYYLRVSLGDRKIDKQIIVQH